jgi:hypothetical protein
VTAADEWRQLTSCMKGALLTKITGHEWNHWQVSSTHDVKPADISTRTDEVLGFIFPKADRTFSMSSRGRVSLNPTPIHLFMYWELLPWFLLRCRVFTASSYSVQFLAPSGLNFRLGSHRASNGYKLPCESCNLRDLHLRRFR